tara:strand:+ start:1288 stop:1620 length:333 start_codon:yes stop_codon:yes gene_type:complete
MQLQSGDFCPLINGKCKQFECKFWSQIKGTNPQTGQEIDEWECTITMLPFLLLENSQQSRHVGAAVESFRNVSVEQTQRLTKAMVDAQEIVPNLLKESLNNNKGIIEGNK